MNRCLKCGKETSNKKFCSSSCSASYNNKGIRRHGKKPKAIKCLCCGVETTNPKYCGFKCQHKHKRLIAIENGTIQHRSLKIHLMENDNRCSCCGITEWNGKDIVLELEHKDGNSENNSLDNVELLCPNCHSQTPTYKNRNKGNGRHNRRTRYAEGKSY